MTGNPNDLIVVSPEEKPVKYQTEASEAIKQLKSKLKAPEFVYPAPTERVSVDKKADKQARDIKKLVSKLSTQEVTEQDLNQVFSSMNEAGGVKSVLTSPIRAVGLLGKAVVGTAKATTLLSTPQSAAITSAIAADRAVTGLSNVGKKTTSPDADKMSKYHTAIMKQRVAQPKEQTKQQKQTTTQQKIAASQAAKKASAITDIKKTVNRKISDYNQSNKGKDSIDTYSKSGVYGNPKPVKTSPSSDPSAAIIIPSTYRTKTPSSNTTIVSHREWDRDNYIQEKTLAALQKKAEKYEVDYEVVEGVFNQGLVEYDHRGNATVNQFAMQKVNSFLANYLEEKKKTIMVGGRRRRMVGEPPGAVYTRGIIKTSGKNVVWKSGNTTQQKLNRAVTTLKRKIKQSALKVEDTQLDEVGLWDNIHAKRKRIKAGSGERMRKPGSEGAPTKQNFVDAAESVNESFIVDRAAGYSTTYTAADLGIKIQGGFALHPSVTEEGGAGDEGTNKLVNKYKKDTPGEAVEQLQRAIRARRKANTQC